MIRPLLFSGAKPKEYLVSIGLVLAITLLCFVFSGYISYHVTALLLLLGVSAIATVYSLFPVLVAATLSALLLNLLFIPPLYTLHITTPEDYLMFLLYYAIAVINAVFTYRIKREERKTRERAERRNTLKLYNTLFNSLSHELKTPISTIIGAVDTLRENNSVTEGNRQILLAEIDRAGLRLNRQVNNLLDMSRLESGILKVNRDWSDVNELLHTVAKRVYNPGTHTIIIAQNDNLPLFKLDEGLIQQAVLNITQNAVNYTPERSVITLAAAHINDNCEITISDNGPGLPEDSLVELFDKFYRLPDSKTGGTGLGLSIAKGFTEAHDGHIYAGNNDSGGALFTLLIPAVTSYLNKLKNE